MARLFRTLRLPRPLVSLTPQQTRLTSKVTENLDRSGISGEGRHLAQKGRPVLAIRRAAMVNMALSLSREISGILTNRFGLAAHHVGQAYGFHQFSNGTNDELWFVELEEVALCFGNDPFAVA